MKFKKSLPYSPLKVKLLVTIFNLLKVTYTNLNQVSLYPLFFPVGLYKFFHALPLMSI